MMRSVKLCGLCLEIYKFDYMEGGSRIQGRHIQIRGSKLPVGANNLRGVDNRT